MRTPRLYKFCDGLTEGVIYFMVVFSPWAFGTTQDWSIWAMNICGFALGALLITKWMVRRKADFRPERWGENDSTPENSLRQTVNPQTWGTYLTIALAGLTILTLSYCFVSALNRRALFSTPENRFEFFNDYVGWLPHSYDGPATWRISWT